MFKTNSSFNELFIDSFNPQHQLGPDHIIPTKNYQAIDVDDPVVLQLQIGDSTICQESIVTFMENAAAKYPNIYALVTKRNGIKIKWTYTEYLSQIKTAAKGFIKLGLERFHGVCILGFNAPEWFISHFAAIFSGGLATGIYTTNSSQSCYHILNDTSANVAVVENEVQLNKILKVKNALPHLKVIIQYTGLPNEEGVLSWEDLMTTGKDVPDEVLNRRIRSLTINQCCAVVYTSATTGNAKGVMLHHDNILYAGKFFCKHAIKVPKGNLLSYLPLSHVAAMVCDLYGPPQSGATVYFPDADVLKGKLVDYLLEVRPAAFFAVPRIFEKISEKIREAEDEMNVIKKKLFQWARRTAIEYNTELISSLKGVPPTPISYTICRNTILKKLKQHLGLDRSLFFFAGGAPMNHDVLKYFLSLDIKVTDCFGMSETSGPAITNSEKNFRLGTVGKIATGDIKIDNPDETGQGELLIKGRHVFMGYLNLQEETEKSFQANNWLKTGDMASQDKDGYVAITGRFKELIVTSGGENVAPLYIENTIKQLLPVVSNCMVVGDKRKYLTMVITLKTDVNLDTLLPTDRLTTIAQDWCREIGSHARTVTDILEGPDDKIFLAVQSKIDDYNTNYSISNAQKIQKWVILPKDFSIPSGEFGPSLKLKRHVVLENNKDIVEGMYA